MEKLNISNYKGLEHLTNLNCVESILRGGLRSKWDLKDSDNKDPNFYSFSGSPGYKSISFGLMLNDTSFKEWVIPWRNQGTFCLLIDYKKINPKVNFELGCYMYSDEKKEPLAKKFWETLCEFLEKENIHGRNIGKTSEMATSPFLNGRELNLHEFIDLLTKSNVSSYSHSEFLINPPWHKKELSYELMHKLNLPKEVITGIVVSPHIEYVFQYSDGKDMCIPQTFFGKGSRRFEELKSSAQNMKTYTSSDNHKRIIKLMKKLKKEGNAHLVPIYTNEGNIIWSK